MSSEEQPKGFQVRDRRRFTESGAARAETSDEERDAKPTAEEAPRRPAGAEPPARITLSTFLISLSTQALMLLGEIPNPMTGEVETDLPGVQEVIDLIAMLQEKTRGNVDPAETNLFEKILFDLRMRYVEKVRK